MKKLTTSIYLTFLGCVAIVLVLASRFWVLDKGLIFSDEGWYLTLIRDNPEVSMSTRFFKLFQFGIQNDIYKLKLISYSLQIISLFVFGLSIYCYNKSVCSKKSLLLCFGIVALGSLGLPAISTPNYIDLNLVFGLLSISSILFWLSKKQIIFILTSSFFTTSLFLAQPTSMILLPILFLFIILQSETKWKDTFAFAAGCALFCILYFFIESPREIYNSVVNVAEKTIGNGHNDYGVFFLVVWTVKTFLYIFKLCLCAYAYIMIRRLVINQIQNPYLRYILLCLILCFVIAYVNHYIEPYKNSIIPLLTINQLGIPFILLFMVVLENIKSINKSKALLILLLGLMPYVLSFGTNVDFPVRYGGFIVFLMPLIFVLFNSSDSTKRITLVYFTICLCLGFTSFKKQNWSHEMPSEQTVSVRSIGINQNLKLSPRHIEQLKFCQINIDKDIPCLTMWRTWGVVALLDLKPITYTFGNSENMNWIGIIDEYMSTHDKLTIIASSEDSIDFIDKLPKNAFVVNKISDTDIVLVKLEKNNVLNE